MAMPIGQLMMPITARVLQSRGPQVEKLTHVIDRVHPSLNTSVNDLTRPIIKPKCTHSKGLPVASQ